MVGLRFAMAHGHPVRLLFSAICPALVLLARSTNAQAAERSRDPWATGTVVPNFGIGIGGDSRLLHIRLGLGASYFVAPGLAVGLSIHDSIFVYSDRLRQEYPEIHRQLPTNIVDVTPALQYVFFRRRSFAPYVSAGVGPSVLNHGGDILGHWAAAGGAYVSVGGPVYLDLGVGFSGMFPGKACRDAFTYAGEQTTVQFPGLCSFAWGPRMGLLVAFGSRSSAQKLQ